MKKVNILLSLSGIGFVFNNSELIKRCMASASLTAFEICIGIPDKNCCNLVFIVYIIFYLM